MNLRRQPEAIILAHLMDPQRRELYVEGSRDRSFINWVFSNHIDSNTIVREIALVDIPNTTEGGAKGRLLSFAKWLEGRGTRIKCFADADYDRLLKRAASALVWLTDGRDMEGYVLCAKCINKVLKLGIGTEKISAEDILRLIRDPARQIGFLRILSEKESMRLPFQKTPLHRYVHYTSGSLLVRFDGYLSALLQKSKIATRNLPAILNKLGQVGEEFKGAPDNEIIHGKDAFCLIATVLRRLSNKLGEDHIEMLLWTSFEKSDVAGCSNLEAVSKYLAGES